MLEQLLIFTRGGLILWTCQELGKALKGSPIDALIRSCLLEERSGSSAFQYDAPGGSAYTLKWSFHNELGLVFVAVYQRILHLLYVDELLSAVKREFAVIYSPRRTDYREFDDSFRQLLKEAEARADELRRAKHLTQPADAAKKGAVRSSRSQGKSGKASGVQDGNGAEKEDDADGGRKLREISNVKAIGSVAGSKQTNGKIQHGEVPHGGSSDDDGGAKKTTEVAFNVDKLQKLKSKGGKKGAAALPSKVPKEDEGKKKTKQNRVWDDAPVSKLDFTDPASEQAETQVVTVTEQGKSLMDTDEDDGSDFDQEEDGAENKEKEAPKKKSWFSSFIQSVSGKAAIDKEDLVPALKTLKDRLMIKNVAEEIAEELCNSVAASLVGKKLGSFTRISTTVKAAMEEALLRILTPKRSVDILRDVHAAKEQRRPYVIVFVGVNGVGKSTNLAKVAYWLLQHDIRVMMAACDTFRSGAVEQLRTHARRLQIPVFERGYEKDPAMVAREAIREAIHNKTDVVLVDTAGRMQDNEPLMRALSKLVNMNEPDLVLFVGEALVGNDGVDQLMKFSQKLSDLSASFPPRVIDGILLTKFDTVDDKVGAALSMVYKSGAPIMFIGCGQTYTDLKKLNVKSIIKCLLK